MIKKIFGWTFYAIGTPFHLLNKVFRKYLEQISMAAELPCVLIIIYTAYRLVTDGSYISDDTFMTVISFCLMVGTWFLVALLAFTIYTFAVWIIMSGLALLSEFGNILYEFGEKLLGRSSRSSDSINRNDSRQEKTEEEQREEFRKMFREANEAYAKEKARKEHEEQRKKAQQNTRNNREQELQRARALFGPNREFSLQELKAARNRLMRKYHPDNQGGSSAMAKRVNEYYDILLPFAKKT